MSATHPALKSTSKLAGNQNYDVLDYHAGKFKKPDKEFEPRIKNNEKSVSQLLQKSSCYQPPRRRKKKQPDQNQNANTDPDSGASTFRKSFQDPNQTERGDDQEEEILDETARKSLNDSNLLNVSSR